MPRSTVWGLKTLSVKGLWLLSRCSLSGYSSSNPMGYWTYTTAEAILYILRLLVFGEGCDCFLLADYRSLLNIWFHGSFLLFRWWVWDVRYRHGQNRGDGAVGYSLFVVLLTFEQVPKLGQLVVPGSPAGEKLPPAPGSDYLLLGRDPAWIFNVCSYTMTILETRCTYTQTDENGRGEGRSEPIHKQTWFLSASQNICLFQAQR